MRRIHEKLKSELKRMGCFVDGIYYCPHLPGEGCSCRKPEPGLILRAAEDLGIDIAASWMIGDKEIDLEAAKRAGCRGIRVQTNLGDLVNWRLAERWSLSERSPSDFRWTKDLMQISDTTRSPAQGWDRPRHCASLLLAPSANGRALR